MANENLRKLELYQHSLLGLQHLLEEERPKGIIDATVVRTLEQEVSRINADFPALLPPFRDYDFYSHEGSSRRPLYRISGILSYLAVALARVRTSIEPTESAPVTQVREFLFVKDAQLREVLERDYSEIQRAYIARCWKSVIILSGGAIEAMLLDQLVHDQANARASSKAPKEPDIMKWDLVNLIAVCVDLGYVSAGVEKLSHSVREYRNLVHPGNEIRNKLTFDAEEAKIALEVLHLVWRDLNKGTD